MAELNQSTETGPVAAPAPSANATAAPKVKNSNARAAVPVWDPVAQKLKAVAFDQAPDFVKMGYKVGGDAQVEALNNSGLAQTAAATSGIANTTSAGAYDAILSQSKSGKALLDTERTASEANPWARFGGEIAGMGLTAAAGGFGGVGGETLKDVAAIGGIKAIGAETAGARLGYKALEYGARGARVGLEAAPYMAVKGAMDTVTENALLDHPVTAQQLAAGAFHSVVEGAGINIFAHGAFKTVGGVRKATGASMDYLEKWGVLKREMEEIPHDYGAAGKPKTKSTQYERTYTTGEPGTTGEPISDKYRLNPAQLERESAPSLEHDIESEGHEGAGDILSNAEGAPEPSNLPANLDLTSEMAAPAATGESPIVGHLREAIDAADPTLSVNMGGAVERPKLVLPERPEPTPLERQPHIPSHYPEFQPPIPLPRKEFRVPMALQNARAQIEKHGSAVELAEFDAAHARELAEELTPKERLVINRANGEAPKAAEAPKADASEPQDPASINLEFGWKKGLKPQMKIAKLREMMKERLADAHPEALGKWKENKQLEDAIKELEAGERTAQNDKIIDSLIEKKNALKAELDVMAPREIDKEAGVFKPGFKDYNDEYARIKRGFIAKDVPAPTFGLSEEAARAQSEAAGRIADQASEAEIHEAKLAAQEARAHKQAVSQAEYAEDKLADAERKLADAETKLERLEKDFEEKKRIDTEHRDAGDERKLTVAENAYNARITAIEAAERGKITRLEVSDRNAQIRIKNAKELRDWNKEVTRLKQEYKDATTEAKAKEKAILDADKAMKKATEKEAAAKETQRKAGERAAARKARDDLIEERRLAREARDDARAKAKKTEKAAEDARKAAEKAQKQAFSDSKKAREAAENYEGTKSHKEKETREFTDEEGVKTETRERHIKGKHVRERITVTVKPHEPKPTYKKGKYKSAWDGSDFANVGKAGFYTGYGHAASYVAAGMAGHNAAIYLANQRKVLGELWEKYMGGLAKGASVSYKHSKRAEAGRHHGNMAQSVINVRDYPKVAKAVGYLSQNPEAVVGYMQRAHPGLSAHKPELVSSVTGNIQRALEQLNQIIPKKPFAPSLQDAGFKPTRAQQIAVLRMWQAMGNPGQALAFGDHTIFSALDKAYPDLQDSNREQLMHHVSSAKKPMRGRQARQYSQFIGAPVRPNDDAAALKRMQQTAGPEPMKKPTGGQSGGGSSKMKTQAVQRDMPAGSQSLIGG